MRAFVVFLLLLAGVAAAPCAAEERIFATALPGLLYSSSCWSEIELHNLGARTATVELDGHRGGGGALVGLAGRPQNSLRLAPGERASVRLEVENGEAWAEVRETIPSPGMRPVVAVAAKTQCVDGDVLRSVERPGTYPMPNASFSLDSNGVRSEGEVLLVVNASAQAMRLAACYSAGHLVSGRRGDLVFLCSLEIEMTVAPFGSRRLETERDGKALVWLRTTGRSVVLQMLKPAAEKLNLYSVDSSIEFQGEAR